MLSQYQIDIIALVVAIVGAASSIIFSVYNISSIKKQLALQFDTHLELVIPSRRFIINEASFPLTIKNSGPRTAVQIELLFIHQLTGTTVRIDPTNNISVSPNESITINSFFEVNAILQRLSVYDPLTHKILSRDPISFAIQYKWQVPGLETIKREIKDLTFIWQGGHRGGGIEWDVA